MVIATTLSPGNNLNDTPQQLQTFLIYYVGAGGNSGSSSNRECQHFVLYSWMQQKSKERWHRPVSCAWQTQRV
jgi:hypothetical protein